MNFKSLRVALAILLILPQQLAFAAPNDSLYTISIDSTVFSGPGSLQVEIFGTGNGNPYVGPANKINEQHDVEVDWGDSTAIEIAEMHNFSDPTPADGVKNFTGPWSDTHTYLQPGTYTVTVKLYHLNSQGAEASEGIFIDVINVGTGDLTVIKQVTNNDGGTAQVADFPLFIDQTSVTSGSTTALVPGTYTVSETSNANYTATFSGDCDSNGSITIADGDNKTCTITNDDIAVIPPTTLTVVKQVINNDSGTAQVGDFTLFVGQTQVTSGVSNEFAPGTYTVSEGANADYVGAFTGDCDATGSVTLEEGDNKTCTIVNDDVSEEAPTKGTIVVVKEVVNDDGGTGVAGDFNIDVTVNETVVDTVAGDSQGVLVQVDPGSYSVEEQAAAGYDATYSAGCSGNIEAGDVVQCTVTNDDIAVEPVPAQLTVTKVVVNDDGGTAQVSDFTLFVDQTQVTSGVANEYAAGAYVVSEGANANYVGTFSGDCDANGNVTLAEGDNKTCTLTNDDIPAEAELPELTVTKVVVNDNGGTAEVADFPLHVCLVPEVVVIEENEATPDAVNEEICFDVVSGVPNDFKPGDYVVSEDGNDAYTATFSGDCSSEDGSIQLGFDDVKSCTITNDDVRRGGGGGGGSNGGGGGGGGGAGGRPTPGREPSDNPEVELTESGDLVCENNGFADYTGEVANWLICEGIAHGYNDNQSLYTPEDTIIYGDFSKLLARGFGVVQEPHVIGSGTDKYLEALSNFEATSGLLKKDKKLEKISVEEANALASAVAGFVVDFGDKTSGLKRNKAAEVIFDAVHQN